MNLLYYYGDKVPLRILDEIEFWKHQEAEHTVVIREIVPNLEPEYVSALQQWEFQLTKTETMAVSYIETVIRSKGKINPHFMQRMIAFIDYCLQQSITFVAFLYNLQQESNAVKNNKTAIVVINHIIRESEYFIGIAQTIH